MDDSVLKTMKDDQELKRLLKAAAGIEMTPEQLEAQKKSFAKGNVMLSNPDMTDAQFEEAYNNYKAKSK